MAIVCCLIFCSIAFNLHTQHTYVIGNVTLQDIFTSANVCTLACDRRRRLGKWSQQEVESLIRKMEAAHNWCHIRDEWPRLGFPRRSAVDLKDKWRNLEGVVLHGKATRTVQLTGEQKERIHRCYRKYRAMQPASSPVASHSSPQKQTQVIEESSPVKRHKSASDSYGPSDEQKSSSTSGSPMKKDATPVLTPMTTRSRARASGQRQSSKSPAQNKNNTQYSRRVMLETQKRVEVDCVS